MALLLMVKSLQKNTNLLRRERRDLATLYWATRESGMASWIFLAGFSTLFVSVVFSIARFFDIQFLLDISFYGMAATTLGAILATVHLLKKCMILTFLWYSLGKKMGNAASASATVVSSVHKRKIRQVRKVTLLQIILTLTRLCATTAAMVALPLAIAQKGYGVVWNRDLPLWLAMGAVVAAIFATILFFFVEYGVRYKITPKLGPFICELFRTEIEAIYKAMETPDNSIDPVDEMEAERWDYTAREFLSIWRFDTVFAADRFGQILLYIQGGMESLEDHPNSLL